MRYTLSLALLSAVILTGCPSPSPGPITTRVTGLKALPTDAGNIRGFVYGLESYRQPIPGVRVQAGRFTTTTGNPKEAELVTEELDDGRTITVMHTFQPSDGPRLAERRPRSYRGTGCDPNDARFLYGSESWDCAYVYLRPGEFVFEAVPAGPNGVKPLVCDLESPETTVQVVAGAVQDHVELKVDLPFIVALESHDTLHVADWKAVSPNAAVKITAAPGGGYQLEPGEVSVTLRSPPGSGGVTVVATEVEYKWTVEQGSKVIRRSSGRREIPRVTVPAGAGICWGPATDLLVPLGSTALDGALAGSGAEATSQVEATISFINEQGFPILSRTLEAVKVPVTLSR